MYQGMPVVAGAPRYTARAIDIDIDVIVANEVSTYMLAPRECDYRNLHHADDRTGAPASTQIVFDAGTTVVTFVALPASNPKVAG